MTYDNPQQHESWNIQRVGQGILIEGGMVLLSGNRWYTARPLVWTLPGGRAEQGEGVEEAVIREFEEETGLKVKVTGLAYVAEAQSRVRRQTFFTGAFTVQLISGELSCHADSGVEKLSFVSPAELTSYLPSPSLGDPLRWYLQNPQSSARYWFFPEYTAE